MKFKYTWHRIFGNQTRKKKKLLEYLSWDNKDLKIVFTMFMFIYQSLNCIIEITRTFCLNAFQNIQ